MRLTCPNCDAKYEVDDGLIPPAGRDVQCSDCGHSWYQYPPGSEFDIDEEDEIDDLAPPLSSAPLSSAPPSSPPLSSPPLSSAPPPATTQPVTPTTPRAAPTPTVAPQPAAPRRVLDENVAAILREEAAREVAARAAEGRLPQRGIEVQADLGLAPPAARTRPAPPPRPPVEDLTGEALAVAPSTRRAQLPDIEQINSTLRSNTLRRPKVAEHLPDVFDDGAVPASGFRIGFVSVILVAILLVLLNAQAPRIAAAVPALAEPLGAYTRVIDRVQVAINSLADRITGVP